MPDPCFRGHTSRPFADREWHPGNFLGHTAIGRVLLQRTLHNLHAQWILKTCQWHTHTVFSETGSSQARYRHGPGKNWRNPNHLFL